MRHPITDSDVHEGRLLAPFLSLHPPAQPIRSGRAAPARLNRPRIASFLWCVVSAVGWIASAVAAQDALVQPPDRAVRPPAVATETSRFVIVEGQVTNAVGAGQMDVTVTVRRATKGGGQGGRIAKTTTDAFGDFVVTAAEAVQGDVVVIFTKTHYADLVREVSIAAGEWPPYLALELEGDLKLAGVVKDARTGGPVAEVQVTCKSDGRDRSGRTDRAGRFTIASLSPGSAELRIEADGFGRERRRIKKVEEGLEITFQLQPERVIHVRVVDDLNEPIAGVTVEIYDPPREDFRSTVADSEGMATVRGLHFDVRSIHVRLTHEDHVSTRAFDRTIELTPGKTESTHTVILPRAAVITGEIIDAKSGKAIYSARVMTHSADGLSDDSPRDWTDEAGRFTIRGVPTGATTVTVHMADYAPELEIVDVQAGDNAKLSIKLHRSVGLRGVVKDQKGLPIAGAHVDTARWRGRETLGLRAVADLEGKFVLRDVPRDEFEIIVRAIGFGPVTQTVNTGAAELAEIILSEAADVGGQPRAGPSVGDPVPAVTLTTLEGKTINLADLKGKTVVLNFWATWCPPCIEELEHLIKVHEKFGKRKDFLIIGLSRDFEEAALRNFLKRNKKVAWPQVFGEKGGVDAASEKLGITWIPRVLIIGPDGRVLANDFPRAEEIPKRIEEILKKRDRT